MRNSRTLVLEKAVLDISELKVGEEYHFNSQDTPKLDKSEPVNLFYRTQGKVSPRGKVQILRQRSYGSRNQHLSGDFEYLGRNKNGNTSRV